MDIWLFDQLVPHFSEFLFCVTAPLTSPVHPFQSDPEGMIVEVLHFLYRSTDTVVVIGSSQFSIKRRHEYRELDVSVEKRDSNLAFSKLRFICKDFNLLYCPP